MIARKFTLEEAASYHNLTEERFEEMRAKPEQIDFSSQDPSFHTSKPDYDELTHVKVRLLHYEKLPINWNSRRIDPNKKKTKVDKAIIHFHGGGFICMDSANHQNYTRRWVNKLKVPVFSVDYRLAPKYPYPDPINDCFQAYVWILTQANE